MAQVNQRRAEYMQFVFRYTFLIDLHHEFYSLLLAQYIWIAQDQGARSFGVVGLNYMEQAWGDCHNISQKSHF